MTYYVVIPTSDSEFIEFMRFGGWTTSKTVLQLYADEYDEFMTYKVYEFNCVDDNEMFDVVKEELGEEMSPLTELYASASEINPYLYHVSTSEVEDRYGIEGISDVQYQQVCQSIIRSSVNMMRLAKILKDDKFGSNIGKLIQKYVAVTILLDTGAIEDTNYVKYFPQLSGVHTGSGIFGILDMVAFTRCSLGLPI